MGEICKLPSSADVVFTRADEQWSLELLSMFQTNERAQAARYGFLGQGHGNSKLRELYLQRAAAFERYNHAVHGEHPHLVSLRTAEEVICGELLFEEQQEGLGQ